MRLACNDVIYVEQGKMFDISIECVDEDDNVALCGNAFGIMH